MNTYSVSRLALALAFGVTLSACSSTPADQQPSTQTAPGTTARPILNADEAKNFTPAAYFQSLTPNAAAWTPSAISLPAQPDFIVGPAGTQGAIPPSRRRSMRRLPVIQIAVCLLPSCLASTRERFTYRRRLAP